MTAVVAQRPRLRVRLSGEGRAETRALARSALAHAAFVLVLVAADWLNRVPWRQPQSVRVGLVRASALPPAPAAPARASAPRRAEPVPPITPPPRPVPEPEPAPELPGIALPPVETPRVEPPEGPKPTATAPPPRPTAARPRPTASSSPAPATTAASAEASGAAATSQFGIAAAVEGWEGGPGDPYLDGIVRRVSGKWLKPRTGLPPTPATVTFTIDRSGRVDDIRLERPSGSGMFDRAALRAVELAAPLPPLPVGVRSERLKVHFDFLP